MKLRSRLFWVVFAAFAVFAGGCTSKSGQGGANETVSLVGAGSTFINPIMTRWTANFQQTHPNVQINYQSIGSGAGIQQVKAGTVDFGASDVALNDEKLKDMPPVIQIPESAGPVCITYNLPDVKEPLKLTAATLSGIYLGTIKNWHDPAIVRANPGVKLPSTAIAVVHRSDGSGTTGIFTTYLAAVNPDWSKKVGASISVNWPVGLGGKGSEGVTGVVKQTPGAIGYVELSYATQNHLPVVEMENKAGKFVAPSAAGTTASIDAFKAELSQDVRKPIVDPPASAPDAYPISGFTFLIIPKDGSDRAKRQELKDFVQYILTDGQQLSQGLDYAPLPSSISSLDQNLLSQMTAAGAPLK
ncbi:MAG TPA: phosphate ABC transporter substrate-binding protein PstS [Terriglobales bacterium]|jgi:phosphate transport system substrate-binding protein|nr:phosphate ABC transporter substrate-binding protein PstS [Terriglobales bacterium]